MSFVASKNKKNILVGAASLLVGATAEAATDIGYTRDGVTLTKAGTFLEIIPDQVVNPVIIQKIGETYTITTNLLESTLDNLKLAWGEAGDVVAGKLSLGIEATNLVEKVLLFYGLAPKTTDTGDYGERKITFYKVVSMDYGAMVSNRASENVIPVTFRALYDETEKCVALVEDSGGS